MKSVATLHTLHQEPFQRHPAKNAAQQTCAPVAPSPAGLAACPAPYSPSTTAGLTLPHPKPAFFPLRISPSPSSPLALLSREPCTSCPGIPSCCHPRAGLIQRIYEIKCNHSKTHEHPLSVLFLTVQASSHKFSLPSSLNTYYSISLTPVCKATRQLFSSALCLAAGPGLGLLAVPTLAPVSSLKGKPLWEEDLRTV